MIDRKLRLPAEGVSPSKPDNIVAAALGSSGTLIVHLNNEKYTKYQS